MNDKRRFLAVCILAFSGIAVPPKPATAQATATPQPAPADTPSIKVGATIFADYTYSTNPTTLDADSNRVHANQFNVSRAYINVAGNLSHLVAFRITPDITRENGTGSSLNGSLTLRLKYAFGQLNLDDWLTKGSWVRLGIQQTPWIDFEESIYRYRFQGAVFTDREGYLSSSDAGASVHVNLPSSFGDVHAGIYNGETYSKAEANDQKALQARVTLRPFANLSPVLHGVRASLFYDADHYVQDAARRRLVGALTFEHRYLNAGAEILKTKDRTSAAKPEVEASGYTLFATPRMPNGVEALVRYDHLTPNTAIDAQKRNRTVVGLAYWLPQRGSVTAAVLLDYEATRFVNAAPSQPSQNRLALHTLINF